MCASVANLYTHRHLSWIKQIQMFINVLIQNDQRVNKSAVIVHVMIFTYNAIWFSIIEEHVYVQSIETMYCNIHQQMGKHWIVFTIENWSSLLWWRTWFDIYKSILLLLEKYLLKNLKIYYRKTVSLPNS